jgi:hypothetical protein
MPASIAQFVQLLQTHGLGSAEARGYRQQFGDDADFQRRAETAERLFKHRRWILKSLSEDSAEQVSRPGVGGRPATNSAG